MKIISIISLFLAFLGLFLLKKYLLFGYLSESILALTAIILLWYTFEKYQIRKSTEEQSNKTKRPVVGYQLWRNPVSANDTRFKIINHSDYPVAVRVKFNIKINNKNQTNIWPSYDGIEYWNLQYGEIKEGHFDIFTLYKKSPDVSKDLKIKFDQFKRISYGRGIQDRPEKYLGLPKLSIEIELYSENDLGMYIYYPPTYYEYDLVNLNWVPILTSKRPYWQCDKKPKWLKMV